MVKQKWWDRGRVTTACELLGAGCLTVAAGLAGIPYGLATAGALLIAFGWLAS